MSQAIKNVYQRLYPGVGVVQKSIARADSTRVADTAELKKRFIRLWLKLLEEEITRL